MLQIRTIDFNGGHREYYDAEVKVNEITNERHWNNLWLKKTKKIILEVISAPNDVFEDALDEQIEFPKTFIIHDFAETLSNLCIDEILSMKVGYADPNQQYYHGVNPFLASIIKNKEVLQLI